MKTISISNDSLYPKLHFLLWAPPCKPPENEDMRLDSVGQLWILTTTFSLGAVHYIIVNISQDVSQKVHVSIFFKFIEKKRLFSKKYLQRMMYVFHHSGESNRYIQ